MKPQPKSILGPSIRAQIKDGLKGKDLGRGGTAVTPRREGWLGNEKEQPQKQKETRATCRSRKDKDLEDEQAEGGGSLASRPGVLCLQ